MLDSSFRTELTKRGPLARAVKTGGRVGDRPGHPFRGNQWTKALGASAVKAARENGGGTLSAKVHGGGITSGYVVAEKPKASMAKPAADLTPSDVSKWIAKHSRDLKAPGANVGVWHDTESGKVWMDIVTVYPNTPDGRKKAIKSGRKHNQIAIFHLDSMEEISTGGDGLAKGAPKFAVFSPLDPDAITTWLHDKPIVAKRYLVRKATSSDYPVRPAQQGADQRSRQQSNANRTQRNQQRPAPQPAGYVSSAEHQQRVQAAQKSANKRRKGKGPTKAQSRLMKFAEGLKAAGITADDLIKGKGGISGKDEKTHAAMLRALKMAGVKVNITADGSGMFIHPDTGDKVIIAAPPGSTTSWTNEGKVNRPAPKIDRYKP